MAVSKRILVADRDIVWRLICRGQLGEDLGYEVIEAVNRRETLARLEEHVDLVLLDLELSGQSSFEVLREMRERHPECPVITSTAYPREAREEEARRIGVFRYFEKPVRSEEFEAAIEEALAESGTKPLP